MKLESSKKKKKKKISLIHEIHMFQDLFYGPARLNIIHISFSHAFKGNLCLDSGEQLLHFVTLFKNEPGNKTLSSVME